MIPHHVPPQSKHRSELAVLVACHAFLVALPARSVVRLFLPHEVTDLALTEGRGPFLGTLRAGGRVCAAWDLGTMLELEPLSNAWAVLEVARGGAHATVALRTGVCALVAEVSPESSLPGRIFRSRAQAFPAAFAAASVDASLPALFGLWLDPARLFTDAELALARDAVDAHRVSTGP